MASIKHDAEKLPAHHKSAWFGFIKSLATFRGDLASLTAPPFLLSPQSMIEFSTYWAEHPSLFVAPSLEPEPSQRILSVTKWFLSTLKQQHSNRDASGKKKGMKPLNPFLGEIFLGDWVDGVGETRLVAEQVSHHPPVTAFRCWNEKCGVSLRGHVAPHVYFSSTVHIDRKGYSVLHLDKYDEDYLITMPKIHIEGLMTGSLAPELSGTSWIRGSSGYTVKIEYTGKGWIGGKRNGFVASVYREEGEVLYTVEGQWSGEWVVREGKKGEILERFNIDDVERTPLTVKPVEEQHPLESRQAWSNVVGAIRKGDIFGVGHEKSKIENQQREMRKQEKADGAEFPRRYFSWAEDDPVAEKLAEGIKCDISLKGGMDGIYMWDESKYKRIHHPGLTKGNGIKSPTRTRFDSGVGGVIMDEVAASS